MSGIDLRREMTVRDVLIDVSVSLTLIASAGVTKWFAEFLFPAGVPFPYSLILHARDLTTLLWATATIIRYFRIVFRELNSTINQIRSSGLWKRGIRKISSIQSNIENSWIHMSRRSRELTVLLLILLTSTALFAFTHETIHLVFPPCYGMFSIALGYMLEFTSTGKLKAGRILWLSMIIIFASLIILMVFRSHGLADLFSRSLYSPSPDLTIAPTPMRWANEVSASLAHDGLLVAFQRPSTPNAVAALAATISTHPSQDVSRIALANSSTPSALHLRTKLMQLQIDHSTAVTLQTGSSQARLHPPASYPPLASYDRSSSRIFDTPHVYIQNSFHLPANLRAYVTTPATTSTDTPTPVPSEPYRMPGKSTDYLSGILLLLAALTSLLRGVWRKNKPIPNLAFKRVGLCASPMAV